MQDVVYTFRTASFTIGGGRFIFRVRPIGSCREDLWIVEQGKEPLKTDTSILALRGHVMRRIPTAALCKKSVQYICLHYSYEQSRLDWNLPNFGLY